MDMSVIHRVIHIVIDIVIVIHNTHSHRHSYRVSLYTSQCTSALPLHWHCSSYQIIYKIPNIIANAAMILKSRLHLYNQSGVFYFF